MEEKEILTEDEASVQISIPEQELPPKITKEDFDAAATSSKGKTSFMFKTILYNNISKRYID